MSAHIHEGDLVAHPGVVYDYTEIRGGLDARDADTRTAFPRLTTIGGGLDARGVDTRMAFPRLTTIGGTLDARDADTRTAFPRLTTIGGWLDARGVDTRMAFPRLTTIGGTLDARDADTRTAFPCLRHRGDADALRRALARHRLTLDDGILCHVVRRRGAVTRVRRVGSRDLSYLVTDGTHHAHGATLAEARADLRVKQGDRDTTPYRGWTRETVVSQADAIAAYRAVTGACGLGVSEFLRGRRLPARLSVARILDETQGAYGHDAFAKFVGAAS